MRAAIVRALAPDGWSVAQADNGRSGLAAVEDASPDAIILDLVMPEMSGFEFLDELRERAWARDIPVLVVTAKDLSDAENAGLSGTCSASWRSTLSTRGSAAATRLARPQRGRRAQRPQRAAEAA